jgi:hypothetical protein
MSDFYDESVRPWLPYWLGGLKRVEVDDIEEEEEQQQGGEQHTKAE